MLKDQWRYFALTVLHPVKCKIRAIYDYNFTYMAGVLNAAILSEDTLAIWGCVNVLIVE